MNLKKTWPENLQEKIYFLVQSGQIYHKMIADLVNPMPVK